MNGLTGLDTRDLDVLGAVIHWWRMNGLKGLDIRDLDVKGLEPTGGELAPRGLGIEELDAQDFKPTALLNTRMPRFVKTSYQDKKGQRE